MEKLFFQRCQLICSRAFAEMNDSFENANAKRRKDIGVNAINSDPS
jgi:cytochrome oxidase Cu insertion factor (SCO1/SenC/PrrC family)